MKINEKGTNMDITPEIKDYLYKKLAYIEKFLNPNDDSVLCEVELGKTTNHHKGGDIFMTEINLHMAGKNLRTVSEVEDLFSSIDIAKDEIIRIIQLNKDKRISLVRRGGAKIKNIVRGIFSK
jgi:ribosomal subunit interface protein